jgi:diguanylate cyclase (GGDEF)-like protein
MFVSKWLIAFAIAGGVLLAALWVVTLALLVRARRRERQLARCDLLTGLANREAFLERTAAELNRSRRSGRPLTVAFIDCDDFKRINDTRGHLAGDDLLRAIAATLRANVRGYDVVARWAGDEFAVLIPEASLESAETIVRRLQAVLLRVVQEHSWPVTFSIGAVTFIEPPASAAETVRLADELMYSVKQQGKGAAAFKIWTGVSS